jgi:hypothetical protein
MSINSKRETDVPKTTNRGKSAIYSNYKKNVYAPSTSRIEKTLITKNIQNIQNQNNSSRIQSAKFYVGAINTPRIHSPAFKMIKMEYLINKESQRKRKEKYYLK